MNDRENLSYVSSSRLYICELESSALKLCHDMAHEIDFDSERRLLAGILFVSKG